MVMVVVGHAKANEVIELAREMVDTHTHQHNTKVRAILPGPDCPLGGTKHMAPFTCTPIHRFFTAPPSLIKKTQLVLNTSKVETQQDKLPIENVLSILLNTFRTSCLATNYFRT